MFFFLKVAQNAPKSAKMKANTGSQLIFFDKNEYLGCRVKIFAYICALIAIDIPLEKDCLLPIYFRSNVLGKDQPPPIFQHKALLTKRRARVGRTSSVCFHRPLSVYILFPSRLPLPWIGSGYFFILTELVTATQRRSPLPPEYIIVHVAEITPGTHPLYQCLIKWLYL